MSYYLVITGWTLAYLVQSVAGGAQNFGAFTNGYWGVAAFAISAGVVGLVMSFGVKHGVKSGVRIRGWRLTSRSPSS